MTALPSDAYLRFGRDGVAGVNSTVRLTGNSHVYCHLYDDQAPIISVDDAHVHMAISVPDPGQVTEDDVTCARLLAEAVGQYVAELERRVAASRKTPAGPGDCAGQAA